MGLIASFMVLQSTNPAHNAATVTGKRVVRFMCHGSTLGRKQTQGRTRMLSDDELTELERRLVEVAGTGEMLDLLASESEDQQVQSIDCASRQPLRGELASAIQR